MGAVPRLRSDPRGCAQPAADRCRCLPVLRRLAGDAALFFGPDDDPAGIAADLIDVIDHDAPGRLAHRVRAGFAWEAVYRERIAPLLDRA